MLRLLWLQKKIPITFWRTGPEVYLLKQSTRIWAQSSVSPRLVISGD